jgi:hypothetical protein
MSRSYRKPIITDGYGTKRRRAAKTFANHRVRKKTDIPNGSAYRKVTDPWNICDFKIPVWTPPKDGEVRHAFGRIRNRSREELLQDYRRKLRK